MNNEVINKLKVIQENIKILNDNSIQRSIICVSKTFSIDKLMPLIDFGHVHFGENKVQETEMKWSEIRKTNKNIKLGICGEHGGDPKSIEFCSRRGLNYVSCSPFRVPVARLAAAQAELSK